MPRSDVVPAARNETGMDCPPEPVEARQSVSALTGTVASGNAKCRSPAAEYESRLEFLLFGLQSAVIFLNIFFDLIGDPKKF